MNTFLETRASRLFAHAAAMSERFSGSENYSFVKTLNFSSVLETCLRLFPLVPRDQVWGVVNDLLSSQELHTLSFGHEDFSVSMQQALSVRQARLLDAACVFMVLTVEASSLEVVDNAAKTPDVYTLLDRFDYLTSDECHEITEALEEHFTFTPKL